MNVLTLGTFDGLHAGHTAFLANCAAFGTVTVGVNSDSFVRRYKNIGTTYSQEQRLAAIAAMRDVTHALINDGPGHELIRELRPDVVAVGPDWVRRDYLSQIEMTEKDLFGIGVTLAFLPPARVPGLSSGSRRG